MSASRIQAGTRHGEFGAFDVGAEMSPLERDHTPEVTALSQTDELLRRLTEPEDFAHIADPSVTASRPLTTLIASKLLGCAARCSSAGSL